MSSIFKSLTRKTQSFKQKIGTSREYKDIEFEELYDAFERQETVNKDIERHTFELYHHYHGMVTALFMLSEDYRQSFSTKEISKDQIEMSSTLDNLAHSLENTIVKPFQISVQSEVLDPLKTYGKSYAQARILIKKRNDRVLDLTRERDLFRKNSKKPKKVSDSRKRYDEAKLAFNAVDKDAKDAMVNVLNQKLTTVHFGYAKLLRAIGDLYQAMSSSNISGSMYQLSNLNAPNIKYEAKVVYEDNWSGPLSPANVQVTNVQQQVNPYDQGVVEQTTVQETQQTQQYPAESYTFPQDNTTGKIVNDTPFNNVNEWFYLDSENQQIGPYTWEEFKNLYATNTITSNTRVFNTGLTDWSAVSSVPELEKNLTGTATY